MHIISEIGRWKKSMGREGMERLEKLDNWTEGWEGGRFVKADILDDYRLRTEDQVSMQGTRYVQSTDLACRGNQRPERDLTNRAAQI